VAASDKAGGGSLGPSTDSRNVPVVDPTPNVNDLVEASSRRQDDLRKASERAQHAESKALRREAEIRANYEEMLRHAESDRINAIREVDVGAVQRAAEVQATQAGTLAAQVATTADAFRASLAAALAPIQASIEDLRRAQYEAQGQKAEAGEASLGSRAWAAIVVTAAVGFLGVVSAGIAIVVTLTH